MTLFWTPYLNRMLQWHPPTHPLQMQRIDRLQTRPVIPAVQTHRFNLFLRSPFTGSLL